LFHYELHCMTRRHQVWRVRLIAYKFPATVAAGFRHAGYCSSSVYCNVGCAHIVAAASSRKASEE